MGLGGLTSISLKQSNSCNIINPLLVRSTQKGYQLEREREREREREVTE